MQPHKICPNCHQAAPLDAPQCVRCGHKYRTQFSSASQQTHQSATILGGTSQNSASSKLACSVCGRTFNILTQHHFDSASGMCKNCLLVHQRRMEARINHFRTALHQAAQHNHYIFSDQVILQLHEYARQLSMTPQQAFSHVKPDCIEILRRFYHVAKNDGVITPQEEEHLRCLERWFFLVPNDTSGIWSEIQYLQLVNSIRAGKLPTITPSITMPISEVCHWESQATYYKVLTSQTKLLPGNLILSNQKFRFVSQMGGFEFGLSKIAGVRYQHPGGIFLQLTRTQGNGFYECQQGPILAEVIQALIRMNNRHLIQQQTSSRQIPQHIKAAVFQRDQGRCVQCGSTSNIEYDHIIPFSRGGATSENNLQILCHSCNKAKSDKI